MSTVADQKAYWRAHIAAESQRHGAAELAAASNRLCERLRGQPVWQEAPSVLLFAAMPGEPDTTPLIVEALANGKIVVLPRFARETRTYEVRQVRDWQRDIVAGHYGIREPSAACPVVPLNLLDFVLVPGVAFDAAGRRLGRGKGYFDRMLAQVRGFTCGIAFEWQMIPEVPAEPHDVVLDCILTPSRWLVVSSPGRF